MLGNFMVGNTLGMEVLLLHAGGAQIRCWRASHKMRTFEHRFLDGSIVLFYTQRVIDQHSRYFSIVAYR